MNTIEPTDRPEVDATLRVTTGEAIEMPVIPVLALGATEIAAKLL